MNIEKVNYNEQRVITSKQLANLYGCDVQRILQNFNNNKGKFVEGRHYFKLSGDALKEFKATVGSSIQSTDLKFVSVLILWTKRGASRHCKSVDTEQAWEVFEELEETYFAVQEGRIASADSRQIVMPNFSDPVAAARAWADQYEAKRLAEAKVDCLQIELDQSKEYYSIKRVAETNHVFWKMFDWRTLKRISAEIGTAVKKIFDANYGEVNVYHADAWKRAYPDAKL